MEDIPLAPVHGDAAQPDIARPQNNSQQSTDSQTAAEYINDQLQLEADAREALPYTFDTCTQPLGSLRQILFSCLTCNPPPSDPESPYSPAGVCYSCSIACHGEHTLVELFNKRNFVCDCGTTRIPSTPCTLRINDRTGTKGNVKGEPPAATNHYNQNFHNRFCGCRCDYDATKERGTMYQCLGLGTAADGGCGEDWWHPECIVGLERDWYRKTPREPAQAEGEPRKSNPPANGDEQSSSHPPEARTTADEEEPPVPPGFPQEDDFDGFICYQCVEANPWIKRYANTEGFLPPVFVGDKTLQKEQAKGMSLADHDTSDSKATGEMSSEIKALKRKMTDDDDQTTSTQKKIRSENGEVKAEDPSSCRYESLPPAPTGMISLLFESSFRERLCRCANCFPTLSKHPQLLEEEASYEPPLSQSGDDGPAGSSIGTASLYDRGERALSNVDRVRAIEGVMVYNHLKDKVKTFLQPFAENGKAVSAEDIKEYFEKLRGDSEGVKAAGAAAADSDDRDEGSNRREQSGY
ncbi:MAG: hypothetical protein M1817_004141 [Caeruleum heppii]|nr:MAG: hypothetical protein M1817_004141 [Caeruleum heppii]